MLDLFYPSGKSSKPLFIYGGRWLLYWLLLLFSQTLFANSSTAKYDDGNIVLCNDVAKLVISENAELLSCVDLQTNVDIASQSHKKIAFAKTTHGEIIEASRAFLDNHKLCVIIGHSKVDLDVRIYKHYFAFEVTSDDLPDVESLSFIDLKLNYDYSLTNGFIAAGVAMTLQTDPCFYPSGENREVQGRCMVNTGFKGAKLAVIACKKNDLRGYIKEVYNSIPPGIIPINYAGGPFALDNDYNRRDCLMLNDIDSSSLQSQIDFYSHWGIQLLDIEIGPKTFVQGQFSFPNYGSASVFNKLIVKPLEEAGIISSLHTYSFYIGYNANDILSNPKWQQQLEIREVFSLVKNISVTDKDVIITGNKSALKNEQSFWVVHSPYLLIDNEIIKYYVGENSLISIQRGQCGTIAEPHKAGAKVKLIGGYYSHIAPQPGSELFYEIAHRTATAYNEGGFRGIYFDALDGLGVHLRYSGLGDYVWYYGAAFLNEVLKFCKEPPVVECATLYPSIWSARGKGGAWDTPYRGYKDFINDHISVNKALMNSHYLTTLGWYNFFPTSTDLPMGYSTKYMFSDDVDYLGVKSILYDQPMVYERLREKDLQTIPGLKRNMELYMQYNQLRRQTYFSDNVKERLKLGAYEYKLIKKRGGWVFREAVYCRTKIRDINTFSFDGNNPFRKQQPFIRLENLFSSDCDTSVLLAEFNEKEDVSIHNKIEYPKCLNIKGLNAIKVTVKGNGEDSKDAICIRLCSPGSTDGYADYVIKTNFEGWKIVVLSDLDNAEFLHLKFKGMEDQLYKTHRFPVEFSRISSMQVFLAGECRGVRLKSVEAVPLVSNALINPSIKLGSATITFIDTLKSGEYIEYQVGDKRATIFNNIGTSRTANITRSGKLKVPKGEFSATVNATTENSNAPSEVVLTFGLYGNYIKN